MKERLQEFLTKEGWFTLTMMGIAGGVYSLTYLISLGTKLLLGLILLLLLTLLISGAAIVSAQLKKKEGASESTEKNKESLLHEVKAIIANVPENHIWVLRNVWGSNPDTFEGYWEKKEGWRIFIPYLVHDEVKLISLVPLQRDPDLIEVNTKDNLLPLVDYRTKTWVAQYPASDKLAIDKAAIKYSLRIEDRVAVEDQWTHVALNRVSADHYCSKPVDTEGIGLTEMTREELEELSTEVTKIFNQEMEFFGIKGEIAIQNIRPPRAIEAAASQVTVAKLRQTAANYEAAAMKKVIQETGASPTWTLIAESLANAARGIFGAKEEKPAGSSEKKEEKK